MSVETHDSTVWEGYDIVNKSLEKGILLTKDVVRFFKKRLEIEEVYCKSLQKAVQKFEPAVSNGFIGEHLAACWQEIRAETEVQASLHESMLSAMKEFVCDPFENLILDLEAKYKTFASEGQKSLADTKESVSKLKKMKVGYDKLYREQMDVGTAAGAGTASKRDTQKLQRRTLRLTHELIKADGDYKNQIAETNSIQNIYVKDHIPKLMNMFNNMESVRLHIFKNYLIKYYTTIETLPHTFPNHKRNIIDLLNMTSGEEDVTEFLSKNKIQIAPPKPFEYEPTVDEPPPTRSGRPVSTQLTPSALASLASGGGGGTKKEPSPASSPTLTAKRSEPIPTPTKKEGLFSVAKTPSGSKRDGSSPPVASSIPSSSSKKKDAPGMQSSGSRDSATGRPVSTSNKEKESRNWWFRTKRNSQHNLRPKHSIFGVKMDDIMTDQKHDHPDVIIPYLLVVLRDVIIKMDGPRTEGIFRVPGNANDVIAFKKQFDDGNYEIVTDNVHTAAAIFKLWLRELPDPVFPYAIYEKCLVASASASTALAMVDQLPEVNRNVLRFVIQLLLEISKHEPVNKMGIDNLAMVFAPCLLRSTSSNPASLLENSTKEKEFIVALMENLPMPGGPPTTDTDSSPHHTHTSSPSTPSTTPPSTTNHLSTSGHSELMSSSEDDTRRTANNPSLSAILEEDESPVKKAPVFAKPATPVATAPAEVPVVATSASLLDDGDTLQAPLTMVASTTFSPRQPSAPQVQEAHRVRVQVRAESIASHLTTYLQNLSQSEISTTKMHNATNLIKQKLMILDEFLHNLASQTLPEAKKESSSPFLHLRPNYTVPPLPSSADNAAQEAHAELARVVIQMHEKLQKIAASAEVSNSASEVKTGKKLLKTLKIDIVEKPLDEGDKKPEANGVAPNTDKKSEQESGRGGEGAEEEAVDAVEILKSLETRIGAKRALLESNEDELSADAVADLTDQRMAFARAISPIKKDLDQFCKDCKIEVVADARYPVDDMNSEVKFLRKMILHVIARICYLTKEGVAYIQQQTDAKETREAHHRLASIIENLS